VSSDLSVACGASQGTKWGALLGAEE
jgi:hypothetical protein